jgi:hypothetical protein
MASFRFTLFGAALFAPVLIPAYAVAEDMAPAALNSFSSVPTAVSSAQVLDQSGHVLGKVDRVQTDQDGKPAAVALRGSSGKLVVVPASAVSYDGRVLITSSDQPQIAELIGAPTRTASK